MGTFEVKVLNEHSALLELQQVERLLDSLAALELRRTRVAALITCRAELRAGIEHANPEVTLRIYLPNVGSTRCTADVP